MFGEQRFTYVRILTVILTPYCTYHCTIVDSSVVPFLTCASTVSTDPRWLWLRLARLRLRLGLQAPSSQARLQARLQARRLPLTSFSIRCTSSVIMVDSTHGSNGMMKCWMPSATVHVSTYLRSLYIALSIIDNMQGTTGRPTTRQPQAGGSCERKQNNRPTDRQESVFFDSADRPIDRSTDRFTESWKTRNVGEYVDFHKKVRKT